MKVILYRDENFFGSDEKQINIVLHTAYEIGLNAIRYKNAPFGRLKNIVNEYSLVQISRDS